MVTMSNRFNDNVEGNEGQSKRGYESRRPYGGFTLAGSSAGTYCSPILGHATQIDIHQEACSSCCGGSGSSRSTATTTTTTVANSVSSSRSGSGNGSCRTNGQRTGNRDSDRCVNSRTQDCGRDSTCGPQANRSKSCDRRADDICVPDEGPGLRDTHAVSGIKREGPRLHNDRDLPRDSGRPKRCVSSSGRGRETAHTTLLSERDRSSRLDQVMACYCPGASTRPARTQPKPPAIAAKIATVQGIAPDTDAVNLPFDSSVQDVSKSRRPSWFDPMSPVLLQDRAAGRSAGRAAGAAAVNVALQNLLQQPVTMEPHMRVNPTTTPCRQRTPGRTTAAAVDSLTMAVATAAAAADAAVARLAATPERVRRACWLDPSQPALTAPIRPLSANRSPCPRPPPAGHVRPPSPLLRPPSPGVAATTVLPSRAASWRTKAAIDVTSSIRRTATTSDGGMGPSLCERRADAMRTLVQVRTTIPLAALSRLPYGGGIDFQETRVVHVPPVARGGEGPRRVVTRGWLVAANNADGNVGGIAEPGFGLPVEVARKEVIVRLTASQLAILDRIALALAACGCADGIDDDGGGDGQTVQEPTHAATLATDLAPQFDDDELFRELGCYEAVRQRLDLVYGGAVARRWLQPLLGWDVQGVPGGLAADRYRLVLYTLWAGCGSLLQHLVNEGCSVRHSPAVRRLLVRQALTQLTEVLMLLEGVGVVHGDLKLENFVVSSGRTIAMIDLDGAVLLPLETLAGLAAAAAVDATAAAEARRRLAMHPVTPRMMTQRFAAPEMLYGQLRTLKRNVRQSGAGPLVHAVKTAPALAPLLTVMAGARGGAAREEVMRHGPVSTACAVSHAWLLGASLQPVLERMVGLLRQSGAWQAGGDGDERFFRGLRAMVGGWMAVLPSERPIAAEMGVQVATLGEGME